MKKKTNKIVASLLVGAMAMSLTACASADGSGNETSAPAADTTTTTDAPAADTTTATTESTETAEAPAEVVKPDKITVMWDGTIFKEGDNYAEAFYEALNEALGVNVEFIRPDHSTYAEQVGIAFTDKSTLADVVILPSNMYASYASQGNLWNMTEAWKNSETANSGRLTSVADTVVNSWYVTGADGQEGIYGMYPARGNGCITYVKAKTAEAAGYTADTLPTTWAEYQDFLLALKDATGSAPVLAAGLVTQEAPYTNYLPEFYQDAYPEFYFNGSQWVDGFSEQSMIDALDRLAWGYANGVLDPQILEQPSTSDVRNKFYEYDAQTSIFTYWAGTWAYTIKSNLLKAVPEGTSEEDTAKAGEVWNMKPIAELGSYIERLSPMICITSACENPEGVFQYFIDKILDGGDVQMLWQYGVENVHYQWNEDGATITGLATEATAGTEKESKTTKNLFEANLKIGNFSGTDPYTPADPVIDEAFNLFNETSKQAPKVNSSDIYNSYAPTLWTEKLELIAKVTQGEMTGAEAIEKYNADCAAIVEAILADFNK